MHFVSPSETDADTKKAQDLAQGHAALARDSFVNATIAERFPDLKGPTQTAPIEEVLGNSIFVHGWDWSGLSDEDREAWRKAEVLLYDEEAFHARYAELQAAVVASYAEVDPTYFRLNIWGMSRYRDLMESLGMVNDDSHPDWPEADGFNIPQIEQTYGGGFKDQDGSPTYMDHDEDSPEYAAYSAAHDAVRAFDSGTPGIPYHKFCSNDGWIVTPRQCQSALDIWERYDAETKDGIRQLADADEEDARRTALLARIEAGVAAVGATREDGSRIVTTIVEPYVPDPVKWYWDAWIDFISRARSAGGFEVW